MNTEKWTERKFLEIWLAAGEGVATESQLSLLNDWVISDAEARRYLYTLAVHQSWLMWNCSPPLKDWMLTGLLSEQLHAADEDFESVDSLQQAEKGFPEEKPRQIAAHFDGRVADGKIVPRSLAEGNRYQGRIVVLAFVLGACLAGVLAFPSWDRFPRWDGGGPQQKVALELNQEDSVVTINPVYSAQFVGSTHCVWDPVLGVQPTFGQRFSSGEALNLFSGIAQFVIQVGHGEVQFQLEGPASIMLAAEGLPSLQYGKITVTTTGLAQAIPIETPFGRIYVPSDSEIGINAFGSTGAVHAFAGSAVVESPWLVSRDGNLKRLSISAGESASLENISEEPTVVRKGSSNRSLFAQEISMETDFLSVGPAYVKEIKRATPVAYWRFENEQQGITRNEMADRLHLRMEEAVRWVGSKGNQAVEFGITEQDKTPGGLLTCRTGWDQVLHDDSYTLEMWAKPSHLHLGTMLSFVSKGAGVFKDRGHGILFELCGPVWPTPWHAPGRICFLHRSPGGSDYKKGTYCFSDAKYQVRHWQHFVAVKDKQQMKLFLDGQLVASAEDETPVAEDLMLLIGLIHFRATTPKETRRFVGQMDEIAVYDRPLSGQEIRRHYQLLRPRLDSPKTTGVAVF